MKKIGSALTLKITLFFLLNLLAVDLLMAQMPGGMDLSFNTIDQVAGQGVGFNGGVGTLVRLPNGKILTGGNHNTYNGKAALKIARLNADGSLDSTFFAATTMDNDVYKLLVLPDGKILAAGAFTRYAGVARDRMMRLDSNGVLDTSFHPSFNNDVNHILALPNGKIYAVGNFTTVNGLSRNKIIRLLPNGEIDSTFKIGSGFGGFYPYSIGLYKDTSILVGGSFNTYNGRYCNGLVRIFKDGSMDTTWNMGVGLNAGVKACVPTTDNKVLAIGFFTYFNDKVANGIVRLDSLGRYDSTFVTGSGFDSIMNSMELLPNGDVIVMGYFNKYRGRNFPQIVKIKPDGSYDTTFNCGTGTEGRVHCFAFEPDGRMVIGGYMLNYSNTYKKHLVRVNPTNGEVDLQFNLQTGSSSPVLALMQQPNGHVLAGGNIQVFNGHRINGLFRLLPNGTRDETFNAALQDKATVTCLALGSTGKIYAAGDLVRYAKLGRSPVVRLNTDGSIDPTFSTGNGFNNLINAIALQPDGKLWVAGAFTAYDGISRKSLARLNENGSLDSSINLGTGFNTALTDLLVQTDGKLLAAGNFTLYNGKACKRLVRLNLDGSLDTTFNTGTGFGGGLNKIKLQADGKIICFGTFTNFNGVNKTAILRLNPNGSLDTSFNNGFNGAVFGSSINAVDIQSDGKIIFAGNVSAYRGTQIKHLARINVDGSLDPSFSVGAGANTTSMNSLAIQTDGKIVIGGPFSTINNMGKNGIARLLGGNLYILTQQPSKFNYCAGDTLSVPFTVYNSYDANNVFTAELSDSAGDFNSSTVVGFLNATGSSRVPVTIPTNIWAGSKYRLRITSLSPANIGTDNGKNISLNRTLSPSINGPDSIEPLKQTSSIYTLSNALASDSFVVSISPALAGTWVRTGLSITVTWNAAYTGNVSVKVKGINSCGVGNEVSKETFLHTLTSMDENLASENFEVFPNPAYNKIEVLVPGSTGSNNLEVFDMKGNCMVKIAASHKNKIEVSDWPKGLYFIRVGATVKKLVIR